MITSLVNAKASIIYSRSATAKPVAPAWRFPPQPSALSVRMKKDENEPHELMRYIRYIPRHNRSLPI